jgi:hypothetical protein
MLVRVREWREEEVERVEVGRGRREERSEREK